jgi:uncharacterized membrane protein
MNRWIRTAAWLLFIAVMYMILKDAVRHWVDLPGPGDIGFTLIFVSFSIVHCAACGGWKRTGIFFAVAAIVSYLCEEIGVRTSWVYGAYHYSGMLGPKLGHVPVLIPLAWFMMIYPSWILARTLTRGVETRSAVGLAGQAVIAAMVMTAWDTVMDPGMSAAGNWIWEHGGAYFGVPLHNYFGWLLTTFLVYLAAGMLWRSQVRISGVSKGFATLPILVYGFYAVSYAMPRQIPALQIVALFAMVMPAMLALIQVWLRSESVKNTGV